MRLQSVYIVRNGFRKKTVDGRNIVLLGRICVRLKNGIRSSVLREVGLD